MCKECRTTVFSRRDFAASLAHKSQDVKAYENLVQFERGIRLMLPKFQRLLLLLQYAASFYLLYYADLDAEILTNRHRPLS